MRKVLSITLLLFVSLISVFCANKTPVASWVLDVSDYTELSDFPDSELKNFFKNTTIEKIEFSKNHDFDKDLAHLWSVTTSPEEMKAAASKKDIKAVKEKKKLSTTSITYKDAMYDVDLFFRIMKYTYGAYKYFGGDEFFNMVKANVKKALEKEFGNQKSIQIASFNYIFETVWRQYIYDTHFTMNGKRECKRFATYSIPLDFKKDENGYYVIYDGKKSYFDYCSNKEALIQPYLTYEGDISYSLFLSTNKDFDYNCIIHFKDGYQEQRTFGVLPNLKRETNYSYSETNGLGYTTIRTTQDFKKDSDTGEQLAKLAKEANVLIVDIRRNGGDSVHSFLIQLLGQLTEPYDFGILTKTALEPMNAGTVSYGHEWIKLWNEIEPDHNYNTQGRVTPNGKPIIILVDSYTGCGAEIFVDYLRNVENVIVIGLNTAGVGFCSGVENPLYLPHSNLEFSCGGFILFNNGFENIEDSGLQPDIWCKDDPNLLQSVVKMLVKQGWISGNPEQISLTLQNNPIMVRK